LQCTSNERSPFDRVILNEGRIAAAAEGPHFRSVKQSAIANRQSAIGNRQYFRLANPQPTQSAQWA
jgi:hypothetical protein